MNKTIVLFNRTFTNKYAKVLRPLTSDELHALASSIKNRGILVTIFVDEEDNVLDGWHRLLTASELGLAEVPIKVLYGLSESEKERLAVVLNIARRQSTDAEKAALIEKVLRRDPTKSSRVVAEETKTTPTKVEEVRKTIEANGVPAEDRKAADGGSVPEKKPKKEKKPKPDGPATETKGDVTTVPEHMADAFQEARRMEVMATAARSGASWFKTSVQAWNKWAPIGELFDLFNRVAKLIEDCTPHAACPACKGYGCKSCRMCGWVPKWKEEELEHEEAGKRN